MREIFFEEIQTKVIPPVTPINRDPLAQAVLSLAEASIGREHLSLGDVTRAVGTQGPCLAAALLVLPFLQPIPMLGLSTPIGFAISLSGVALFLEREVKFPDRLARVKLPCSSVLKTTEFLARFEVKLKPYLKSDRDFNSNFAQRFLGGTIAVHGILLALPLPIPFSNSMPAWMCFFASLTILFASRRLFFVSIAMLLANVVFWSALVLATIWGSHSLVEWLGLT